MRDIDGTYRLNGVTPPVGTILGPDALGRGLCVAAVDESGCDLRFATQEDGDGMLQRMLVTKDPHSVVEVVEFDAWWARMAVTAFQKRSWEGSRR